MTRRTRWIALVALTLALLAPVALLQADPAAQPTNGAAGNGGAVVTTPPAGATNTPAANTPGGTAVGNGANAGGGGNAADNATGNGASNGAGVGKQAQPDYTTYLLYGMIALIVLMFFMQSRGRKKQEAQRREMLSNLKKGDKITTTSGIIGTLIELREDEIVLKVDETNNVRMRFLRGAIMNVGDKPLDQTKK